MKTRLTQIAFVAVAAIGLTTAGLQAGEAKANFKVKGMMCGSCESAVKNAVTKVDGVKSIEADADKGTAVVAYDPAKTSEDKIAAAINTTKFKVEK